MKSQRNNNYFSWNHCKGQHIQEFIYRKPSETPRTSTLTSLSSSDQGTLGTLQKPFKLGYSQYWEGLASSCKFVFMINKGGKNQCASPQDMLREEKNGREKRKRCTWVQVISIIFRCSCYSFGIWALHGNKSPPHLICPSCLLHTSHDNIETPSSSLPALPSP